MMNTIKTPRGTFNIKKEFMTETEANAEDYYYYFTNNDGTDIYTYHIDEYHVRFGIIKHEKSERMNCI